MTEKRPRPAPDVRLIEVSVKRELTVCRILTKFEFNFFGGLLLNIFNFNLSDYHLKTLAVSFYKKN